MSTAASLLKRPELLRSQGFINGQWVAAASGKTFTVINPATGEALGDVPDFSVQELGSAITHTHQAFKEFGKTHHPRARARLIRRWADLILANQEDLATLVTLENGKPHAEAMGEITMTHAYIEWFAEEAARIYGDTMRAGVDPGLRIHTIRQPVGVVGIITPWNFPSSMISRKVGAALAAGCGMVVKPADATPLSALALAFLGQEAGIPDGLLSVITNRSSVAAIGQELCEHKLIRKVSFTGSTRVGKILMGHSAQGVKKISFELGGNAPFIIFDDADIDKAVDGVMKSKFRGSGQTCVCANRIYVHEAVHDDFVAKLGAQIKALKPGNGLEKATTQGPLVSEVAVERVHGQVKDAQAKGATLVTGGRPLAELGPKFFAPTLITGVDSSMSVTQDEIFGPVAAVIKFSDENQLIDDVNSVEVGLAGYFFTRDIARVHRVSEALEVGMVGVNTGLLTDAASPFGGIKESGMGREGSKYGVDDYVVIKSVAVKID